MTAHPALPLGIEISDQQIDRYHHQDQRTAADQNISLQHRIVTVADGFQCHAADTGDSKNAFGYYRTAQNAGKIIAQQSDDGDNDIRQGIACEQVEFIDATYFGDQKILTAKFCQQCAAHKAADSGHGGKSQNESRQQEIFQAARTAGGKPAQLFAEK